MHDPNKLTKRQGDFYDYIKEYIETNGFSPTQKEISAHFGCYGNNTHHMITKIIEKGFLMKKTKYNSGGLSVTQNKSAYSKIADALLSVLESHDDELAMSNLIDDLRLFVSPGGEFPSIIKILDSLIDAARPEQKNPIIYSKRTDPTKHKSGPYIPFQGRPTIY